MIDNPQVKVFCNEKLRPIADMISALSRTLPEFLLRIAEFEELTAQDDNAEVIVDGSAEDGRQQITKLNVLQVKDVCFNLNVWLQDQNRMPLVNTVTVNTNPLY